VKILQKVLGGATFLTHTVYASQCARWQRRLDRVEDETQHKRTVALRRRASFTDTTWHLYDEDWT